MNPIAKEIQKIRKDIKAEKDRVNKLKIMAMNKAVVSARSTAMKEIRKDYNIKEKDLRSASKIIKATRAKLNVQVGFLHSWISLGLFRTRQRKEGIEVRIKKSKGTLFKGTFFNKAAADPKKYIFKRKTTKRTPLDILPAPSAGQMFSTEKVQKEIEKIFWERFESEFKRLLDLKGFNVEDKFH